MYGDRAFCANSSLPTLHVSGCCSAAQGSRHAETREPHSEEPERDGIRARQSEAVPGRGGRARCTGTVWGVAGCVQTETDAH